MKIFNRCLVENLQETACGGSVLSTGCGRSLDLLQRLINKLIREACQRLMLKEI